MISKEDIKKLSELSRIEISDSEAEGLAKDIEPILEYVGQVKSVAGDISNGVEFGPVKNVMREDGPPDGGLNEPGTFSKELIAEFPKSENGYLKVKKIL